MSIPKLSPAFILRRNPVRDNSLLLDLFTREAGKITCVATFSKGQGLRSKGMLEPFRLLEASWVGKGEVFTLFHADEKRRFALKQHGLVRALYLNELLLRVLWPHQPQPELFDQYQLTLQRLLDLSDCLAMPLFELEVLANAGFVLNLYQDDGSGQEIVPQMRYRFLPEQGLFAEEAQDKGVPITGSLLIALRNPSTLNLEQQRELRQVLDHLLLMLLKGKPLNARRLLDEYD